jgi:uncharacterized membrane protein
MKLAGLLLLASGWAILIAAITLLPSSGSRAAFVFAGLAVQVLGLALAARAHRIVDGERS